MNRILSIFHKQAPTSVLHVFVLGILFIVAYLLLLLGWSIIMPFSTHVLLLPYIWHLYGFTPIVLCFLCAHVIAFAIVIKAIKKRSFSIIYTIFLVLSCATLLQLQTAVIAQSLCYAKLTRNEREQPLDHYTAQNGMHYPILPLTYRQCRATISPFDVFKRTYTKDELAEVPW